MKKNIFFGNSVKISLLSILASIVFLTSGCSFIHPESRYLTKVSDEGFEGPFSVIITDSLIFSYSYGYILEVYSCTPSEPLTLLKYLESDGDLGSLKYDGKHLAAFKDSTLIIYHPVSLVRICEEHVPYEYGSVEIDDTILYFIPDYLYSDYIFVYRIDFQLQSMTLIDSIFEPNTHELTRGLEFYFLLQNDSLFFCEMKIDSLKKIGGFSAQWITPRIKEDTVFFTSLGHQVYEYYVENGILKSDTIVIDATSINMEDKGIGSVFPDDDFFYIIFMENNADYLFAYSRKDRKFVSWIDEPGVWKCVANSYFLYTNTGIYKKPE
jgi:hypothetical protein